MPLRNEDFLVKKQGAVLLMVLTAVMGVGPLVNYGLSTTSSLIMAEFQITEAQFGLLATACFFSAALSSSSLGRLSDRISANAQLLIVFGGTSAGLLAIAIAPSYAWLLVAVAIAGPAQAISNPMTTRAIMRSVAADKRAGWIGVKQSGVQGSQFFAGLFFPAVAVLAGWQGAAAAAAAFVGALLLFSWNRLPEGSVPASPGSHMRWDRTGRLIASKADTGAATTARRRHSRRFPAAVWIFTAYSLFSAVGVQATNVYLPLFAQREMGLGLLLAGLTAGLSGLVGVSFRIFWGKKMNSGVRTSTLMVVLAVGALLGAILLLLAGKFHAEPLLWVGVALHGATALGTSVVVIAGVMRDIPAGREGAASGVISLGLYLGFGIGPLAMGGALQLSGGFSFGWAVVGTNYALCVVLALILRGHRLKQAAARIARA
jgi:predicted MFS family arabinose efflux permease